MKLSTLFIFLKKETDAWNFYRLLQCFWYRALSHFASRDVQHSVTGNAHRHAVLSLQRFFTKPFIYTNAALLLAKKPHDVKFARAKFAREASQTKTLANPSAPALAMYGRLGWKATPYIASSNFFRCEVISWTQVLLSRFQRRIEQSWPKRKMKEKQSIECINRGRTGGNTFS